MERDKELEYQYFSLIIFVFSHASFSSFLLSIPSVQHFTFEIWDARYLQASPDSVAQRDWQKIIQETMSWLFKLGRSFDHPSNSIYYDQVIVSFLYLYSVSICFISSIILYCYLISLLVYYFSSFIFQSFLSPFLYSLLHELAIFYLKCCLLTPNLQSRSIYIKNQNQNLSQNSKQQYTTKPHQTTTPQQKDHYYSKFPLHIPPPYYIHFPSSVNFSIN